MSKPSVAIIGAGVPGLSAAARAAAAGCEVRVIERAHPAAGSSGRSAGVFNINAIDALNNEVRIRSRELLDKFERENGLPLARIGYLRLAKSPEHLRLFEDTIAFQEEQGVEARSRIVSVDELSGIVPHLRVDDLLGAIWNDRDGHLDGHLLCTVLLERAQANGAVLVPRAQVVDVARGTKHRHLLRTTNGDFEADVVVNAAGPWAAQVGELLDAPLPLVNQVHEVIKIRLPPVIDYVVPQVQDYIPGGEEAGYFRQEGPHRMIGGLHTYDILDRKGSEDPDNYRQVVDWETLEAVGQYVERRLQVDGLGFAAGWTGLYPISADGQFVVGPYAADQTIVALGGFGGAGVCSGVSLGEVAAEWILFDEPRSVTRASALVPDGRRDARQDRVDVTA